MKTTTTLSAATLLLSAFVGLAITNIALAGPYDAAVLADNPVAYWRFEDGSSNDGDTAADSAGSTDGTYSKITLQANTFNGSANTLGNSARWTTANGAAEGQAGQVPSGSFINFGSPGAGGLSQLTKLDAEGHKQTSLEFWMKTTQTGLDNNWEAPLVFGRESPSDGDIHWGYLRPDGRIGSAAVNDGNHRHHTSINPINDDQWHHVVATYDTAAQQSLLYVDGVLESNFNGGANVSIDAGALIQYMGWNDTTRTPATFLGELDEVAIYDTILTEGQVQAHFEAAIIPEPSSIVLLLLGLIGAATCRWRRRRVA